MRRRIVNVDPTPTAGGIRRRGAGRLLGRGVRLLLPLAVAPGAAAVAFASPAAAAGFSVASGFASYAGGTGTTPVPVQFDVLTLASGGTAAASTLSITGQPSSGTASANTSNGVITYDATTSTSGTQTITFQLCESGPTACQTATLKVGEATATNNAFAVPILGGYANYPVALGASGPTAATTGSTFTEYFAPAALAVPPTLSLDGNTATVNYLTGLTYILPIPANSTYVSGSAAVEGGDATTAGQMTVSLCTTEGGTGSCTATAPSTTFPTETTEPYLDVQLGGSLHIDGGSDVTPPTVTAEFTASGSVGTTIQPQVTEFDAGANVTALGDTITATLATYPVSPSFTSAASGAAAPAYYAYPLSTTTIESPPPVPTVTAVSPTSGPASGGTSVTISGTNLENASAVDFGSTPATITVDGSSQITATAPAGSGTVNVTVTTPGGTSATSAADDYTYVPAPTISGISPSTGPTSGGTAVTISGSNLAGASVVDFGSSPGTVTADSASSITVTSPAGSGTVSVTVTTPSGTATSPTSFTYQAVAAPTISGISPTTGTAAGGTAVTITGTNLTGASLVKFGTASATINSDAATSMTVTTPPGLGNVNVTVTTPGGTATAPEQYAYTTPPGFPSVTALNPTSGPTTGGTTVTVTGTNLTNASAVDFGTQAAFFSGVTATSLTAIAPAGSGAVEITVTTPSGTSVGTAAGTFTYTTPVPTVGGLSPSSGPASGGTVVTVSGTGLYGATSVDFGAAAAPILSDGTTSLTALAPPGSGTVAVTVTTAGGTSASVAADEYTYAAPSAPAVTGVSPATGPASGGTVVTVTGTNLSSPTAVDFGTQPALFSDVTATSLQAIAPAGSGTVDVTVTTGGGTSAKVTADHFVYSGTAPTVTAVAPAFGPANGGTFVTITGTGLSFATSVSFGTAAALVTADSATSVTAVAPPGSGTVDITVTTPGGTSATVAADRFTYGGKPTAAPTITHISPASGPANGGTVVTITGSNLLYASAVEFGSKRAFFTDVTATSIEAIAPAGAGTVAISVTTPAGTSAAVSADKFSYVKAAGIVHGCPAGRGSVACIAPASVIWEAVGGGRFARP